MTGEKHFVDQSSLAVVDMRDNRDVADVLHIKSLIFGCKVTKYFCNHLPSLKEKQKTKTESNRK